ncbi:MAG: DUF262 domain-containing protein [Eubacterium sp.]|nr:DUF262 domain-containing protein [Eubacterium sp.]
MPKENLPLKEISIGELFNGSEKSVYEIPIYQRNYAWDEDEITTLVQDIYDAYNKGDNKLYYIGTLVSYHKGDGVFEIIDGQQRLTTIRLMLDVLDIPYSNQLKYRARKKSDDTLKSIPKFNVDEKDKGIENGYKKAKSAIEKIVSDNDRKDFKSYFQRNVHIIHYEVPKDIDLNHYFEIMNSRGEQLEKHEIVKANLMEKLKDEAERKVFNRIWECCSEMSVYTQQNLSDTEVFGIALNDFLPENFEGLLEKLINSKGTRKDVFEKISIAKIISDEKGSKQERNDEETEIKDSFQPIIDFPNFLLVILKITRMEEQGFSPKEFNLDDKELLAEFNNARMDENKVKKFAYNLLKGRFLLDNYVVHHAKEEDTMDSNPWKLQQWHKENIKGLLKNLTENNTENGFLQDRLTQLLSMFEVSFTARQRKNYLFYCLLYLMEQSKRDLPAYADFVEGLADRYFNKVYLDKSKLNDINTPRPGSFDEVVLEKGENEAYKLCIFELNKKDKGEFVEIYGDGTEVSRGVPLFIFNYLDYKLWKLYDAELRGKKLKEGSKERLDFFAKLGCTDFGLKMFDQFYFSRTRRSLEHYYPQASATGEDGKPNECQINCLGNYAMIGSAANSSGSNWSPETKRIHYLDSKTNLISVASLKFMIMLQLCKDKSRWTFDEMKEHQEKMLAVLMENNQ